MDRRTRSKASKSRQHIRALWRTIRIPLVLLFLFTVFPTLLSYSVTATLLFFNQFIYNFKTFEIRSGQWTHSVDDDLGRADFLDLLNMMKESALGFDDLVPTVHTGHILISILVNMWMGWLLLFGCLLIFGFSMMLYQGLFLPLRSRYSKALNTIQLEDQERGKEH